MNLPLPISIGLVNVSVMMPVVVHAPEPKRIGAS